MRSFLALLILATATLSVPVASAQAGFFTQVVKGNIKNSVRRAKKSAKDAALNGLVATLRLCALPRPPPDAPANKPRARGSDALPRA